MTHDRGGASLTHSGTAGGRVSIRPDTDIIERDDGLYVYSNLPGVAQGDLRLEVEGNVLHLKAETAFGPLHGGRLHALEFDEAQYEGKMILPDTVEKKGISATLSGGVLTVFLPFVQREGPRRIPVTTA